MHRATKPGCTQVRAQELLHGRRPLRSQPQVINQQWAGHSSLGRGVFCSEIRRLKSGDP